MNSHLDSGCWLEIPIGGLSTSMIQLKMRSDTSVWAVPRPKDTVSLRASRIISNIEVRELSQASVPA